MSIVSIREELPADHDAIYQVEKAAFDTPLQAEIVERLRMQVKPFLSLVAVADADVVGHICFSPATIEGEPSIEAAQLSPLAVRPDHHGRGIGSALIREGIKRCRPVGWSLVFLLGDPKFYSRFGFQLAASLGFGYPDPMALPAFHVLALVPHARERVGVVHFHPAFDVAGT
ncbi:MAG: N-acetyltransferase [Actinobacteria bacterium]|nr:N-acetyltransferase [Actinomycetota bacterium]